MGLAELNPECHQYLRLQKNLFLDSTSRGHQHSFSNFSSNFIIFFSNFHHFKMFPLVPGFTCLSYPVFLVWEVLMFCWAYVKIPGSSLQVKILCWIKPAKLLSHEGTIFTLWGEALQRTMEDQGRCRAALCWNGADAHDQPHSYWTLLWPSDFSAIPVPALFPWDKSFQWEYVVGEAGLSCLRQCQGDADDSQGLVPENRNLPLSRACAMSGLCQRHMELAHWRKGDGWWYLPGGEAAGLEPEVG